MDTNKALSDASNTAQTYLRAAIRIVDEVFEEDGAHKKYPEIVSALVKASATDYLATVIRNEVVAHIDLIPDALSSIRDGLK